jgi:hypothetical protein
MKRPLLATQVKLTVITSGTATKTLLLPPYRALTIHNGRASNPDWTSFYSQIDGCETTNKALHLRPATDAPASRDVPNHQRAEVVGMGAPITMPTRFVSPALVHADKARGRRGGVQRHPLGTQGARVDEGMLVQCNTHAAPLLRWRHRELAKTPHVRKTVQGHRRLRLRWAQGNGANDFSIHLRDKALAGGKPFRGIFHALMRSPETQPSLGVGCISRLNKPGQRLQIVIGSEQTYRKVWHSS